MMTNPSINKSVLIPDYVPFFFIILYTFIIALYVLFTSPYFWINIPVRYIIYLTPYIFILPYIIFPPCRNSSLNSNKKYVFIMFTSFIMPAAVALSFSDLKYIIFIWSGFIAFLFPVKIKYSHIIFFFYTCCMLQLLFFALKGGTIRDFNVSSFTTGAAALTHTLPAIFGLITGLFYSLKKYKMLSLGLIMIFISGKRSVLFSSLTGIAVVLLLNTFEKLIIKNTSNSLRILIIILYLLFGIIITLATPSIYEMIAREVNVSPELLSSGRYNGQKLAYESINEASIFQLLLGQGLGKADYYAAKGWSGVTDIIHSDWLRLLIDFGIISGLIFVFCFCRILKVTNLGLYLLIYNTTSWITENNLINIMIVSIMFLLLCVEKPIKLTNNEKVKKQYNFV